LNYIKAPLATFAHLRRVDFPGRVVLFEFKPKAHGLHWPFVEPVARSETSLVAWDRCKKKEHKAVTS
jgi:hypothetical protein